MNISFSKLGFEECKYCRTLEGEDLNEHKKVYRQTPGLYRLDADREWEPDEICVVSFDMQKIIKGPDIEQYKKVLFTSRLIVMNETFASLQNKSSKAPKAC